MEKFKKSIPYLLVLLFLGWASYKFFVERKTRPPEKMTLDWDELDANSGMEAANEPASIKKKEEGPNQGRKLVREHSTLSKTEEDQFALYDKIENKWLGEVKAIFKEHYPVYMQMREGNEKEKMKAYKAYHDYLRQKHGDNFTYNISEDQSIREKKINQDYLKKLLKVVGEEKFKAYIKARDQINEENRRNGNEAIQMEF